MIFYFRMIFHPKIYFQKSSQFFRHFRLKLFFPFWASKQVFAGLRSTNRNKSGNLCHSKTFEAPWTFKKYWVVSLSSPVFCVPHAPLSGWRAAVTLKSRSSKSLSHWNYLSCLKWLPLPFFISAGTQGMSCKCIMPLRGAIKTSLKQFTEGRIRSMWCHSAE